ncbi:MAG: pilus assembly protein [Pseudomonadota bacterium]
MRATNSFWGDETGAITIDWVALTAAVVMLGLILSYSVFETGLGGLADVIDTNLEEVSVIDPVAPTLDALD